MSRRETEDSSRGRRGLRALLLGSLAGAAALGAAPVQGESLVDALTKTYTSNPTLQAQRAAVRATDERVPQALANWRPTVTLSGSGGKAWQETEGKLRPISVKVTNRENLTPRTYQLTVTQPLFRGFQTVNSRSQAEFQVLAARAQLTGTEQSVLLDAITAYMNVVRDQAVLDLNINNVQVLNRQLEATQDRFEVGEVTRTDVSQAEARLARAESDRTSSEGDLESSRAQYLRIVGNLPEMLDQPTSPLEILPVNKEEAVALATDRNPSVVSAVYTERAALKSVSVAQGVLLPTVSLQGQATRSIDQATRASETDVVQGTVQVSIPLYQQGSEYSQVREAKQTASQRRVEIEEAKRQSAEDAIQAWETLITARARIVSLEKEVDSNEIALEGTQQEATAGLRTVLDVLDAEQELLNSRVDLVRARRDELVASYQLLSSVGMLTAGDLGLPVPIYDPTDHYRDVRDKWIGLGEDVGASLIPE